MSNYVYGMLRTATGWKGHFRHVTESQTLTEHIKVIEERYCKGCEVLWIAKGFTPIDPENWPNWVLNEEDPKPKFKPSDTGRYVAIKGHGGKRMGIIVEVLDEEDARVWHPNFNQEEGGQGFACIININKVAALGDWVGILKYPAEFIELARQSSST